MAWGALGDLQFSLLGAPFDFQDKQEVDYAEQPVLDDSPRLQFIGRKLEEITLKIRLHAFLTSNPELDLRSLKDSMIQGDPQALVIGKDQTGIYAGKFVILSLEHDRQEQWPDGRIRLADVTVKLKEWVKTPELGISSRKNPQVQTETRTNRDGVSATVVKR
jgi:phage protein U